ncbi:hypothetical protein PM10SUCC1_20860 [Propionigenium maris DSM 9537]|uniref:Uncharacterized protein n=1 Tax=Propionigenium maris DSM 9537 TaxID=1123000 RepID=A0A9W6GLQ7_9FUSO|nr:hypothetical protein [Propionigenium maris]GLI56572.1 hypothetical protein PM10SUCC1_20860 [Propionigenium maris DSM 9537]
MREVVDKIIEAGSEIPRRDILNKVWVHTALEFQRVAELLTDYGREYEGTYLIGAEHMNQLYRYLERVKRIRAYFYEISEEQLPDILRPPVVEEGEILKIKREIKPSFNNTKEKVIIHITFENCRAKHIEADGRIIIVIADNFNEFTEKVSK